MYPPGFGAGEDTLAGWRGVGGSIVRKTPDTALYISKYFAHWAVHVFTVSFSSVVHHNLDGCMVVVRYLSEESYLSFTGHH